MAERKSSSIAEREQGLTRPWAGHSLGTFQRFADEIDRFFDDFGLGRSASRIPFLTSSFGWNPSVDVHQTGDQLTIRADLPGLSKDDVHVEVTDGAVTIQGERKREQEVDREGFYRSERSYGSFSRVIPLPEGAITEQAKANFRDGVLEITMPSPPTPKARRLEISGDSREAKK
jgi:HSP20 family protein